MKNQIIIERSAFRQIIDRCFFDSVNRVKNKYSGLSKAYSLRFSLILIICIYQQYFRIPQQNDNPLVPYFLIAMLTLQLLRVNYLSHILKTYQNNVQKIQLIAGNLGHGKTIPSILSSVQDPYEQLYIWKQKSKLKVSKKICSYKRNLQNSPQNVYAIQIESLQCEAALQQALRFKWIDHLQLGATIVTVQFTFILFQFYEPQLKIVFLCYLLSQLYLRSKIITVLIIIHILIFLLPICCLCMCYYDRKQFINSLKKIIKSTPKLPKSATATQQIIDKAQGNCSICIQDIILQQQVITLNCSEKHVFHKQCIKDWSLIRKNCPICRTQI